MILKNYWALCEGFAQAAGAYSSDGTFTIQPKDTTGTDLSTFGFSLSSVDAKAQLVPKAGLEVVVGSGDTEPDATDYTLDTDETSNFSDYTVTKEYTMGAAGQGYDIVFLVSGDNSTGSAITLKEVGLTKTISSSFASPDNKTIMLARFLLETPITVAAGGSFHFAFKWSEA